MTRIFVSRGCGASGASLRPGEIYEVSDDDARILISLGKAKPCAEPTLPPIDTDLMPDDGTAGLTTESAAALIEKPRKKTKQ